MKKIASPQELQAELKAIMVFVHASEKPDREVVASKLRELANRVRVTAGEFTEDEWKAHKREHPGADPKDHTITKGDKGGKGRDVSKEEGFESLKGLEPAKQRDLIQKALLNMEAEKAEKKDGPTKQRDVSKEEGFESLKGLSPAAQRKVIERALKKAADSPS